MSNYLKGTETLCWIRLQSDGYLVVASDELDIGFSENKAAPSIMDATGTSHTNKANFDLTTPFFSNNYIIKPRESVLGFSSATDTIFPGEPLTDVVTLDPVLEYENSEFDALGVTDMQVIPIRKKFTLSVTRKAQSGFWLNMCLGDQNGNYASHGVHDVGASGDEADGRLTCHEGRVGYPGYSDVGYCIQIYLGKMDNGRYLVLRANNCILRTAGMSINAADLNEVTFEFVAGSGYYYTLASEPSDGDDLTWSA